MNDRKWGICGLSAHSSTGTVPSEDEDGASATRRTAVISNKNWTNSCFLNVVVFFFFRIDSVHGWPMVSRFGAFLGGGREASVTRFSAAVSAGGLCPKNEA